MNKDIKKTIRNTALISIFLFCINPTVSSTLNRLSLLGSPRLKDNYQVEQIVQSELDKFGQTKKRINVRWKDYANFSGSSEKLKDGEYEICLPLDSRVAQLKHELFHIIDGHCDYDKSHSLISSMFYYFFYGEYKAAFYALGLIKND